MGDKKPFWMTRRGIKTVKRSSRLPGCKSWSDGRGRRATTIVEMNKTSPKAVSMYFALVLRLGTRETVYLTRQQVCELTGIRSKFTVSACLKALHNAGWLARKIVKKRHWNLLAIKFLIQDRLPPIDTVLTKHESAVELATGLRRDRMIRHLCDPNRMLTEVSDAIHPRVAKGYTTFVIQWFKRSGVPIPTIVIHDAGGPILRVCKRKFLRWQLKAGLKIDDWRLELQHRKGDGTWEVERSERPTFFDVTRESFLECSRPFIDRWHEGVEAEEENALGGAAEGEVDANTASPENVAGCEAPRTSEGAILPAGCDGSTGEIEEREFLC